MKKLLVLFSVLISISGIIVLCLQDKQEKPKLKQIDVSEKIIEEVVGDTKSKETENVESEIILGKKAQEENKTNQEIMSDSKAEKKGVSSTSKSETKQENKQNSAVSKETSKESSKENSNASSQNTTGNQSQKSEATTKFYESITGGKKEFRSEGEAFARGTEIQNKELDYVLNYNEHHPEAMIQPDINYFRVYPSVIDDDGQYWYYLHFFCASGEGNDENLKSIY